MHHFNNSVPVTFAGTLSKAYNWGEKGRGATGLSFILNKKIERTKTWVRPTLPGPPSMKSFPPFPYIMSLPSSPSMVSSPGPPHISSSKSEPKICSFPPPKEGKKKKKKANGTEYPSFL